MRTLALSLLCLSAATALSSTIPETILTRDLNIPRHGDRITVIKTELLPAGDAGTCAVWDFSEYVPIDGNHIVKYRNIGDSIISVILNRTRFDYRVAGDTLLWGGYENRLYRMTTDSMSPAALLFPMHYGRMAQSSYTSSGHHPDGFTTSASGIAIISADATGTLILPQADTVANVLRIHRIYRDSTAICRPALNGAIFQPDTLPVHIYEEYAWYAAGYRYPLVQSHIDTFLKGDTIVSRMGSSWICQPSEQEALNDQENSELRLRNRLQNTSNSTRRRLNGNGVTYDYDHNSQPSGTLMDDSSISIRSDNDYISVSAIINAAIEVEIIMSDAQGRVFHHVPEHRVNAGTSIDERFPRRDMPPGVYLIAFMIKNGDNIVQKVILQ